MQCEDNSKLRTPLSEVCQTTDIGCVPITDGKPGCSPQPDELPIAFDPMTTTLWLFSCKAREWIPFQKFTVCQLNALNLENITNICDVLNIAVNYAGSGECQQGTVSLRELAERILECLTLETKIVTIGDGEGNKLKITIEGLPLDPVYVTGRNIWSEGGSGTESDPLKVATYDPICKWPTKTQAEVDAANTKHLGACLDGEMSRIPLPLKVCELPSKNQAQVDDAGSVELVACVDGEGSKIPYPSSPCSYDQLTEEQVSNAQDVNLIACADNKNVKVPYPKFQRPICEADQLTLDQAKERGNNLTLVGCDTGNVIRIPVGGSGFFDRDYICVPETLGPPSSPPIPGTGPLRIGCSGELYVWLCNSEGQGRWEAVRFNSGGLRTLNRNNVPNICENFNMLGWHRVSDDCVENVQFTLNTLVDLLEDCSIQKIGCNQVYQRTIRRVHSKNGSRDFNLHSAQLEEVDQNTDYKIAIYASNLDSFIIGSGVHSPDRDPSEAEPTLGIGEHEIVFTNDDKCPKDVSISLCSEILTIPGEIRNFAVTVVATLTEHPSPTWEVAMRTQGSSASGGTFGGFSPFAAKAMMTSDKNLPDGYYRNSNNVRILRSSDFGIAAREERYTIMPGETVSRYLQAWVVLSSTEDQISPLSTTNNYDIGHAVYANVNIFRRMRF